MQNRALIILAAILLCNTTYSDWVCEVPGDEPPCGVVSSEEVDNAVEMWEEGSMSYEDLMQLINLFNFGVDLPQGSAAEEFPVITNVTMQGAGIAYVVGSFTLTGPTTQESVWVRPVPTVFEGQAPIYLTFRSDNPSLLNEYWFEERGPENLMIEMNVKQLSYGQSITMEWGAYVLLMDKDYSSVPASSPILPAAQYPTEVQEYLLPSAVVQSNHSEIIAQANQLKGSSTDILDVGQKVFNFNKAELGDGSFQSLDALEALRKLAGSCTSHANLAAALLRASGIPARTVANIPTYLRATCLDMHYDVQFYVPGYGWYWMDSANWAKPIYPYEQMSVPIKIEDENRGMETGRSIMRGAAYYSMYEELTVGSAYFNTDGGMTCTRYDGTADTTWGTAGQYKRLYGDLNDSYDHTVRMWNKCLDLKIAGTEPQSARDYQLLAVGSATLTEYVDNIDKAFIACGGTTTTTTTPSSTTTSTTSSSTSSSTTTSTSTTISTTTTTLSGCTMSPGQALSPGDNDIDYQTPHNYLNQMYCGSGTYACPQGYLGKIYVRYVTEQNFDYFYIYNAATGAYTRYSGNSNGYVWLIPQNVSQMIGLKFTSDYSLTAWGVDVDKINCYNASLTTTTTTSLTTTTTSSTTTTMPECPASQGGNLNTGDNDIDFQTPHDYPNQLDCGTDVYACPHGYAAKIYVRYDTEASFDRFYIYDNQTGAYTRYSGNSNGSVWVIPQNTSQKIWLRFTSDYSVTGWGVDVDKINCYKASATTTTSSSSSTTSSASTSTSTTTSSSSTSTTNSTTTTGGSTSTTISCELKGDYPPCGDITLSEVLDMINQWIAGQATLDEVIDIINAWASSP